MRVLTSTDDPHVDKINTLVCANRRLTIRELAEECGISVASCYEIVTAKLKVHHVAAKFVPRLMTGDQKSNRICVCQKLLDRSDEDETYCQELRVHKILLQFVAPPLDCPFYNPTNEKTLVI